MAPRRPPRPPDSIAEALEAFDRHYERQETDAALEVVRAALRRFPDDAQLHHARGMALWAQGHTRRAVQAMERAIALDASFPDPKLDLASLFLDGMGAPEEALRALRAPRRMFAEPNHRASAFRIRGRAWIAMQEPRSAVRELRRAVRQLPGDADLIVDLADARTEMLDFRGAAASLERALQLDPDSARAHWLRAFHLDRSGEAEGAVAEFHEAARLDPDHHFVPQRTPEEEFDRTVESALTAIPPRFRRALDNTEVAVEPYPSDRFLRHHPVSPFVLGLFLGTPMTERGFDSSELPPRILVFQRNLENTCRSRSELKREIGITVRHELGHLLGMEEDDIEDAGHG